MKQTVNVPIKNIHRPFKMENQGRQEILYKRVWKLVSKNGKIHKTGEIDKVFYGGYSHC